jgi:RNase P subunit RPR2
MNTRKVFCANCQTETDHSLSAIAESNVLITTCAICRRDLKFPIGSKAEVEKLLTAHARQNKGQFVITPAVQKQREEDEVKAKALVSALSQ